MLIWNGLYGAQWLLPKVEQLFLRACKGAEEKCGLLADS